MDYISELAQYKHWLEAFHIISVIAWMAGMLYLPRLFVYHADVQVGSEMDLMFQKMELRLIRYIMNPAMVSTLIFGLALAIGTGAYTQIWFHIKFCAVLFMLILHFIFGKYRKDFASGLNNNSHYHFRILNEAVTTLIILIVIMAVVKPFR